MSAAAGEAVVLLLRYAAWVVVIAFAVLAVWRLATRGGLFDIFESPNDLQLLLFTLIGGSAYIASVSDAPAGTLPAVPPELLLLVGASQAAYVGVRAFALPADPTEFKGARDE